jgi:hypothetical protein
MSADWTIAHVKPTALYFWGTEFKCRSEKEYAHDFLLITMFDGRQYGFVQTWFQMGFRS